MGDASVPQPSAVTDADVRYVPVYRDINHVLGTGQSLSVGSQGTPVLTDAQPFDNLMFEAGVVTVDAGLGGWAPLVEGVSPARETHASGFANFVTDLARSRGLRHDLLMSMHGIGGRAYADLKRGTAAFDTGILQVRAAKAIADAAGKSYVVRAVTNVHGETDHRLGNERYAADLAEWQADYEREVRAITGQAEPVPMLHTQMSSWTMIGGSTTSTIPIQQLAASVAQPDAIILVGPKYHLPYVADGVHLSNEGYRHMGEDYAKVYRHVILEGRRWEPLRPIAITREGAVITVKFAVPAPPLVIDEQTVADPGSKGFGYSDDGLTSPGIASVALAGPDTLRITLEFAPTGPNRRLRYAYYGDPLDPGGPQSGPRGNVRDSDATPSRFGYPLWNWCVHFDEPVP